jgi:ankyrin repeat protein
MGELIEALAIQTDNPELDPTLFISPTQLLGCCEGLITYDQTSDEVGFAHFTVFEYLQKNHENDLSKKVELATVSLKYLKMVADKFTNKLSLERSALVYLKFLEPACCYWGFWARENAQNCPEFWELLFNLHESPIMLQKLHQILSLYENNKYIIHQCICDRFTILHLLALGYLVSIFEVLFDITCDEDLNFRLPKPAVHVADCISALAKYCRGNIDNVCYQYGSNLHIASRNDDDQLFRLLITHRAAFNVTQGMHYRTPIHHAAWSGSRSKLEFLHEQGADLSIRDHFGRVPIYYAIDCGSASCVELLLEKGCDVLDWGPSKFRGDSPIGVAARSGNVEILQLLIKAAPALVRSENLVKDIPLHQASMNNDARILKFLLSLPEMDPSGKDGSGRTPLHCAAQGTGYIEPTKVLLDAGTDYTIANNRGHTPLDAALLNGNLHVARVILDHIRLNDSQRLEPESTKSRERELIQQHLLSRIEDDPKQPGYCKTLAHTYVTEGQVEMASQYFDRYRYVQRKWDPTGYFLMYCCQCVSAGSAVTYYHCYSCKRNHDVCEDCFRPLLAHYPPKYFTDHIFHLIPSKQYPESISDFIKSFRARRSDTDTEDESEDESEDEFDSEDEIELEGPRAEGQAFEIPFSIP